MTDENVLPTDEDIEQLIERIESKRFDVTDWDVSGGMYESVTITVEVDFQHPQEEFTATVVESEGKIAKELIANLAEDTKFGVHMDDVQSKLQNDERIDTDPEELIFDLLQQGEVYEPKKEFLRVT